MALCLCLRDRIYALDQFREGFYNTDLPGGPNDPRGLPPIPFSTDTNRFADGLSSTAIMDVASPSFPRYNGALANVTDRLSHHRRYLQSCKEQGIAEAGSGDAVREDAKVRILNVADYQLLPKPNKTFPVYAAIKWNPSDFAIQDGETYRIEVIGSHVGFGSQFWSDGGIRVDANGYESHYDAISNCYVALGRCRQHLKSRRRLQTANWMALTCSIGLFVRPLHQVQVGYEEESRYLPLDESRLQETIFVVGLETEFRAIHSGQLICFANDAQTQYWNNKGELQVTVTRVSWPPTSTVLYQPLYNPACDSAYAVYQNHGEWTNNPECNPDGGGSGWVLSDVVNTVTRYTSGIPDDYVRTHPIV